VIQHPAAAAAARIGSGANLIAADYLPLVAAQSVEPIAVAGYAATA
jgi:hypothetical protein